MMKKNKRKINSITAEHVAEVLKAVAHPARIAIVEILEEGEMCVGDIVEALGSKQAIISQQLNLMKDKGVLECRRDGVNVYYQVKNKNVIRLLDCIRDHCETDGSGRESG
jgi:DNA-binding transcriptional ArsR family regulator